MFQTKAARVLQYVRRTTQAVIEQKQIKINNLEAEIERSDDAMFKLDLRVDAAREEAAVQALRNMLRYAEGIEEYADESPIGPYELQARFLSDQQTTLYGPVIRVDDLEPVTGDKPQHLMAECRVQIARPFVVVAWTEWLDGDECTTLFLVPQSKILAYEVGWPTEDKPPWFRYKNLVSAIDRELHTYLDEAKQKADEAFERLDADSNPTGKGKAARDRDDFCLEAAVIGRCLMTIRRIARYFQAE